MISATAATPRYCVVALMVAGELARQEIVLPPQPG